MKSTTRQSRRQPSLLHRPAAMVVALLAAMIGLVTGLSVGPAYASTVQIADDAHILDATTVQNQAATLAVPILIWTTTQDASSNGSFDTDVRNKVGATFPVVIGINSQSHHATIQVGGAAGITQSAASSAESSAVSAFRSTMRGQNNYTAATVAALGSLQGPLSLSSHAGGNHPVTSHPTGHRSSGSGIGSFIGIALIVILLVVVVRAVMRRRRAVGYQQQPPMYGGQGYGGQGYGGPGYGGGGYGGGGMGAGAAGAIGAVGGGLLGYELGKMEGEREDRGYRGDDSYGNQPSGGNDWVVGQDTDWGDSGGGDSGNNSGGGGDW